MDDPKVEEYWEKMRSDPRSIDVLVATALAEPDEAIAWNAVVALHFRGTKEVLVKAETLAHSDRVAERSLAANILGQLGVPERSYPKECVSFLLEMLDTEKEADVLQAILMALYHQGSDDAIEPASRYYDHPDAEVRHGVVMAMSGHEDPRAIDILIRLSHDQVANVRDWATFGLGTMTNVDSPALREALIERLTDSDYNTRCEAIMGLAKRRDSRVLPAISKELASDRVGYLIVEAVTLFPFPDFHAPLMALKEWWDVDTPLLDEAINASSSAAQTNLSLPENPSIP
jgi:HEAT repeat protein